MRLKLKGKMLGVLGSYPGLAVNLACHRGYRIRGGRRRGVLKASELLVGELQPPLSCQTIPLDHLIAIAFYTLALLQQYTEIVLRLWYALTSRLTIPVSRLPVTGLDTLTQSIQIGKAVLERVRLSYLDISLYVCWVDPQPQ
jgi:hypothetical protein